MAELDQPSWAEIFQAHADRIRAGIHTAMPGTIIAYDETTQLATIQAGVQVRAESSDPDEPAYVALPPLADVPVAWPAGGGFAITMPLAAGDPVLLVFLESDDSAHRASGEVEAPRSPRRHGLCARAVPCGGLDAKTLPSVTGKLVMSSADGSGARIVLDSTAAHLGGEGAGEDFVALAGKVATELGKIATAIGALGGSYVPAAVAATKGKAL